MAVLGVFLLIPSTICAAGTVLGVQTKIFFVRHWEVPFARSSACLKRPDRMFRKDLSQKVVSVLILE